MSLALEPNLREDYLGTSARRKLTKYVYTASEMPPYPHRHHRNHPASIVITIIGTTIVVIVIAIAIAIVVVVVVVAVIAAAFITKIFSRTSTLRNVVYQTLSFKNFVLLFNPLQSILSFHLH